MNDEKEKRVMQVWDVIDAVCSAFYRAYESDNEYWSIKRVFWDQTLVAHRFSDNKDYMLSWSINDAKEVSFSPAEPEGWQEVEEKWEAVERSMGSELRAVLGLEAEEIAKKQPETPENAGKNQEKRTARPGPAPKAEISSDGTERRTFFGEVRAKKEGEGRKITGYAAVFNEPASIWMRDGKGGYVEVEEEIAPGAFDGVMKNDVRALFNHDPNFILGRTAAGTLRLFADERGLGYEVLVPDTAIGRDLLKSIERGDISQSSFGFEVAEDEWGITEGGKDKRTIKRLASLFDVSPVTYPAYATTEATARSLAGSTEEAAKRSDSTYLTPDWIRYRMISKKRV